LGYVSNGRTGRTEAGRGREGIYKQELERLREIEVEEDRE
jgi:hypothetical protein